MPRLPDIDLGTYAEAQRQRFQEATAGLLPALEFQLGTRATEAEIPPDYDAPGGRDQWAEVEKQRLEEEYRRQQQEAEALRQRQIQEQADQYAQQQQQAEAAQAAQAAQAQTQEQNQASVLDQIRALGIPLPGSPFADHSSSSGLTDVPQAAPPSDVDRFNASAGGLMTDAFGAPTPDPLTPGNRDNESSAGLLDRLGSAASSVGETIGSAASSAGSALQSAGSAAGTALTNAGSAAWEASAPRAYRPGTEEYQRYEEDIGRARNSGALAIPGEALIQTNRALSGLADTAMNPIGLIGRTADELLGTPTVGEIIPASRDVPVFGEDLATSKPIEALAPIVPMPGKGDKITTGLGALGRAGARAGADLGAEALEKSAAMLTPRIDDAVGVIQGLLTHGMDDAALVAERSLAERTSLTLEEIQRRTRGLAETVTEAASPEVRAAAGVVPDNVSSAGLVPEAVPDVTPEAPKTIFQTELGSIYEQHPDGTTTRNKAARDIPGHEGDFGPKPQSEATYFVTPEQAQALAPPQGSTRLIDHGDGTLSMATRNADGRWGIAPSARNIPYQTTPEVGLTPIEVWDRQSVNGLPGYGSTHFGNQITNIAESVPPVWGAAPDVAPNVPRPSAFPETPYTRGLTAEDLGIPEGMTRAEDMPPRTTREPGAGIRGFGTLPEHLESPPGGGASMSQEGEDFLRAVNAEQRVGDVPVTARWRHDTIAKMLGEEGDAAKVEAKLTGSLEPADAMSRESAALHQELLKQNVRTWEDAFMTKGNELADAKAAAADFMKQFPDTPVPGEMLQAIEAAATDLKIVEMEFRKNALKQSGFVRAASQRMNAQRGGRQAAVVVSGAQRLEGIGKRLQRIGRAGKAGKIDDALDELGEAAKDLDDVRTRRTLTEPGEGGGGGGGGKRGGTTRPPKPQPPKDETLVERYGRLQREQSRFKNLLDDPKNPLDEAARDGIRGELARVGDEIGETVAQAREEALEAAQKRFEADQIKRGGYTEADLERIADEAVGRRAIGKIRREASDEVTGRGALKTSADLTRSVEKAITRAFKDEQRLAAREARQEQRRIDGILGKEARANIRDEVRQLSQEAQTWIKRIRQLPDQRPGLQEGFDQVLRDLDEHSASGKKVAAELRERLQNHLDEDAYARSFTQARRETDEVNDAMIRAVQDRIKEVQANPNGPGQAARMAELWDQLEQLGGKGVQKASEMRKGLAQRGLLRSGLMAEGANAEKLSEALRKLDPDDPASFRAMLNTMSRPTWWDALRESEMINMLSSVGTNVNNLWSTGWNAGLRLGPRNVGKYVGSLGQTKGQLAAVQGYFGAAPEGLRLAKETMRTGVNPRRLDRALASGDYRRMGGEALPEKLAWVGRKVAGEPGEAVGRFMGTLAHQSSTRALEAGDALLGHMSYEMGFRELAAQKADDLLAAGSDEIADLIDRGSKAKPRNQLYKHILEHPWDFPDLVRDAGKIEDYSLFRSRDPNRIETALRQLVSLKELPDNPTKTDYLKSMFVDFLIPFYNVPFNTTKQGVVNVAQGVASPITAATAIGKALEGKTLGGAEGRALRTVAGERMGRAAQGGLMMAVPTYYAMHDNLTGPGPKDPGQREVWLQEHQPYSWRPGGKGTPWFSYEGMPWAIPFATVGGLADALDQTKNDPTVSPVGRAAQALGGAGQGALKGALSQTFLEGLSDNVKLLSGDVTGSQWAAQALASNAARYSPGALVPFMSSGFLNFLGQMTDDVQRDAGRARSPDDIGEVTGNLIESRIPGLRQALPAQRGAFGEAVRNERRYGLGVIPGYRGFARGEGDPISEQLQEARVGIPRVPDELSYKRGKIPITIAEQQRYQQLYGERYREYLENMNVGREPTNSAALEAIRTKAHEAAQNMLMGEIGSEELSRRWYYEAPREVAP